MKPRILLGEDDEDMRCLLRDELGSDGYEVLAASNGTEALATLSIARRLPMWRPDVIILDVHMPGYSGLDLLSALRGAGWTVPVILITAFGDPRLHENAKRLGATAVFEKPFDMADLRVAVRASSVQPVI